MFQKAIFMINYFILTTLIKKKTLRGFPPTYYAALGDIHLVERILPFDLMFEFTDSEIKRFLKEEKFEKINNSSIFTNEELKEFGFWSDEPIVNEYPRHRHKYSFLTEDKKSLIDDMDLPSYSAEASNCWAISGNYTKSGKPLLVNDPHLDPSLPSQFYMAELNIGSNYIIGGVIPGTPLFASGRTKHIAYGITALTADDTDFFEEEVHNNQYLYKGEWKIFEKFKETIKVKNGEDVNIEIRKSTHGPILDHYSPLLSKAFKVLPAVYLNDTISISWAGSYTKNSLLNSMSALFNYKTITEMMDAFDGTYGGNFALCLADNSNNIGWYPVHRMPKRKDIFQAIRGIKPGFRDDYEWKGYHPSSANPRMLNPKKGYVFSANNKLSTNNVEGGLGVTTATTGRSIRINQILNERIHQKGEKLDADDMKEILKDVYDVYAERKCKIMMSIVDNSETIEKYVKNDTALIQIRKLIDLLQNWNYEFSKDQIEPTIYTLWEFYFIDNLFKTQIPNAKIRRHAAYFQGYDNFLINILEHIDQDPAYFSEY
jgi:penicillin amidase